MKSFSDLRSNISEKTLTPAEMKKREEIAKAIERDNPDMPMAKKMAIATATAKKVAEEQEGVAENVAGDVNSKKRYHFLYPHVPLDMHTDHEYNKLSDRDLQAVKSHQRELAYKLGKPGAEEQSDIASHIQINRARSQYDQEQAHRRKVLDAEKIKRQARDAKRQQGVAEGDQGILWRVEKSEATGRFHAIKGYNKSRKIWKNKYGASDHTSEEEAKARVDKLNQGVAEAIITQPPKKVDIPAAIRKAKGGNWKTTTQDIEADKLRNQSSSQSLAAGRKKEGMAENIELDEAGDMTALLKQLDKHTKLAVEANRAGDDEATKKHQEYINTIKGKMAKAVREEAVDEAGLADLYPAQVITHIIAKSDVSRHRALLKKESGIETKTAPLPMDHSKFSTHVGIVSKGEKESAAHDSGYANPITPYKMKGLSEVNDYFKRRAKEEGIIAGTKPARKAPKKPAEPMSDYSKRRAKEGSVN